MIAKTFMGLEDVLAEELTQLGANNIVKGRRMVAFTGDKEMLYRANFHLRTAIRILKPIAHFRARSADDVYEGVRAIDWSQLIARGKTFAVDSVVYSEEFRNSRFVTYKVKDAIVDQLRECTGERPNISVSNPGESDFIDPMCGSGTLPIEAALIARNIAPGVFRKEYAFEKWADFDRDLFDAIYNDDSAERPFDHHIYGYDTDMKAVNTASFNVRAAGLSKDITIEQRDFKDFTNPGKPSIIVTNPPYGERITTPNLLGTYRMIGERLKHEFAGNEAWVLSYREECFDQIGLKPSVKVPLYNGSLECELRKYTLFDGKMRSFREEGGIVKTEREKEEMAQKHRFKRNREFKQRLAAENDNENGDIRSFRFSSLEMNHLGQPKNRPTGKRRMRGEEADDRHDRGRRRNDNRQHGKPFRQQPDDSRRRGKSDTDKRRRMFGDD